MDNKCLPNADIISSSHEGHLPIDLPPTATKATVYPGLQSSSLISIGASCDADCSATLTKNDLQVYNSDHKLILQGQHNFNDGLWDITLSSLSSQSTPNYWMSG